MFPEALLGDIFSLTANALFLVSFLYAGMNEPLYSVCSFLASFRISNDAMIVCITSISNSSYYSIQILSKSNMEVQALALPVTPICLYLSNAGQDAYILLDILHEK